MPSYTHNVYDPDTYGLGRIDAPTDVVVRYVNNFATIAKKLGLREELKLPWSVEYAFAFDETSVTITKHLTEELRRTIKTDSATEGIDLEQGDDQLNSHILFEKPLAGAWKLQLWVLPQSGHISKLFKFPSSRPDSTDRLDEFLAADKVNIGDHRLYMEAHVVPKYQAE